MHRWSRNETLRPYVCVCVFVCVRPARSKRSPSQAKWVSQGDCGAGGAGARPGAASHLASHDPKYDESVARGHGAAIRPLVFCRGGCACGGRDGKWSSARSVPPHLFALKYTKCLPILKNKYGFICSSEAGIPGNPARIVTKRNLLDKQGT